jgi:hypothetical protein
MPTKSTFSRSILKYFSILLVFALLAGCSGLLKPNPTPVPTPITLESLATPTPLAGDSASAPHVDVATAVPPTLAPTLEEVQVLPPTETSTPVLPQIQSLPTSTPLPATGSIYFAPGTTATVVMGSIQAGQAVTYTLQAAQGQSLILISSSDNNDVTLGVFEPNGNVLLNPAAKRTSWQAILPATELYTIQVTGGATTEAFNLTVKAAQVVNFATGSTSAILNGTTAYGYLFSYSLNCSAGQVMTAALNVPASVATLDIFGMSGGTLLDASLNANTWTGILPNTTAYVIEVVPTNGQVINYSLTVTVTGDSSRSTSQSGDIVIKPGSTAAVVRGTVNPAQVLTYTVQGSLHQPMILILESPKTDLTLGVLYPDGSTFLSPTKKWSYWQWVMPVTGLYTIQIYGGAAVEDYTLTVKQPYLKAFAPGTHSITIKSATEQGYLVSYAFRFSLGQKLTASLDVPADIAYLDIFSMTHGSILDYTAKDSSWTGVLPETDMYIIEVIPRGGGIHGYSLTVSVE